MKQQKDPKGELRGAFAMQELDRAQAGISFGPVGVLVRVTLAVLFMHLIVVSYQVIGIAGPVFVSLLFLVSAFVPVGFQAARAYWARRREQSGEGAGTFNSEARHESGCINKDPQHT